MNKDELKGLGETLIGISRGEPWQYDTGKWCDADEQMNPIIVIRNRTGIRLKPWQLTNTVNGFILPAGKEWHRGDFTKADMEDGHRPLMLGEEVVPWKDELFDMGGWVDARAVFKAMPANLKARTKRPIPAPPVLTPEQEEPVEWVPLDRHDFDIGTAIRFPSWKEGCYAMVGSVSSDAVHYVMSGPASVRFLDLFDGGQINRPCDRDTFGKPLVWHPCRKPAKTK